MLWSMRQADDPLLQQMLALAAGDWWLIFLVGWLDGWSLGVYKVFILVYSLFMRVGPSMDWSSLVEQIVLHRRVPRFDCFPAFRIQVWVVLNLKAQFFTVPSWGLMRLGLLWFVVGLSSMAHVAGIWAIRWFCRSLWLTIPNTDGPFFYITGIAKKGPCK